MNRLLFVGTVVAIVLGTFGLVQAQDEGWIPLFDGKSLEGWKASEHPDTFSVQEGVIVVNGPRSHLYYVGPVENHDFKNFEFRADVMTRPKANSGIYFHTKYQEEGWPAVGYEVQVNNSHSDPRRTGSLYAIQDVHETYVGDDEWFTLCIRVEGKRIMTKINDRTVVDYVEPENPERPADMKQRVLSHGTFALQGHDPESVVYYKNIMVRPLPD
ncbi:MAG TPA: DUF1080 domain-containing protein [Acidobacteriota bacterium]|jgi:hypothetical protein|nr:DUF1080 domain-containing protein [Acidobacteriota bacterium]